MKIKLNNKFKISRKHKKIVKNNRKKIIYSIKNNDKIIIIIGPCSVSNYNSIINYARIIKRYTKKLENILIVLRIFLEKPRTTIGWKGYIYDPEINGNNNINLGIKYSIKVLKEICSMNIAIATEFLNNNIIYHIIRKYISIGIIGARTVESQPHREIVSDLSYPIGYKNNTSGDTICAINSVISSREKHYFISIKKNKIEYKRSKGNKNCFIILRGNCKVNYFREDIEQNRKQCKKHNIPSNIFIDTGHGNSKKNINKQIKIIKYLCKQLNNIRLSGLLIESFINPGNQVITNNINHNTSITDPCIGIIQTIKLLKKINKLFK